MNETAKGIIEKGIAETAVGARERPVVPLREGPPEQPDKPTVAQSYIALDKALGCLPLRFLRAARTLAERHGCVGEWEDVEAAHDALRKHEAG